jgi:hypothetical protein
MILGRSAWVARRFGDATLFIRHVCEPCAIDDETCDLCELAIDAEFHAMRAKYDLSK